MNWMRKHKAGLDAVGIFWAMAVTIALLFVDNPAWVLPVWVIVCGTVIAFYMAEEW